ncbi:MAG: hypothetical protein HY689_00285 [Chloroflexi bacterium]|nr:hypothetical protein [Chloroflexota bacterium]
MPLRRTVQPVRGYKPCVGCGAWPGLLCDAVVGPKGQTCDAPICVNCAQRFRKYPEGTICVRVRGPGAYNAANETIDYCPAHRQETEQTGGRR